MKFGTLLIDGQAIPVIRGTDGSPRRLGLVCRAAGLPEWTSILELVQAGERLESLAVAVDNVAPEAAQPDWAPPLPNPSKILGVAFNNKELMKKAHKDPGVPNFFMKPPSALQGHGKEIIVDPAWGAVIPEPDSRRYRDRNRSTT